MRAFTLLGVLLGISQAFVLPLRAQESDAAQPVASEVAGTGSVTLDVQGTTTESGKQVGVSVDPKDGGASAAGNAAVIGFPMIQNGQWADTDWKVDGSRITGTVKNRDGRIEGTFDGTITATGVSGKFTHVDGRVGLWSWDGPPPRSPGQP